MATDGIHIFYDPNFVLNEVDEEECLTVIAHEAYHCVRKHHLRMGDRDPEDWNKSTDYIINLDLVDAKVGRMPKMGLLDEQYRGLSPEEVYNILKSKPKQEQQPKPQSGSGSKDSKGSGQGSPKPGDKPGKGSKPGNGGKGSKDQGQSPGQGSDGQMMGVTPNGTQIPVPGQFSDPGGMGGVIQPAPHGSAEHSAEEARWDSIFKQAVAVAKSNNAGQMPGWLERAYRDSERPRIPWNERLRNFTDSRQPSLYTYNRQDTRFAHLGLILPGKMPDKPARAVSVIDTSGSINPTILAKYQAENAALLDDYIVDKLTVLYADVGVRGMDEFERGDEVKLKPKGGGGTNFRPVLKHIADTYPDASVILFFTDMIAVDYGDDPGIPLMWVVYSNTAIYDRYKDKAGFGQSIHANL